MFLFYTECNFLCIICKIYHYNEISYGYASIFIFSPNILSIAYLFLVECFIIRYFKLFIKMTLLFFSKAKQLLLINFIKFVIGYVILFIFIFCDLKVLFYFKDVYFEQNYQLISFVLKRISYFMEFYYLFFMFHFSFRLFFILFNCYLIYFSQ